MKYNQEITKILVNYFRQDPEPKLNDIIPLAEKCGLTPSEVKSWFRNKKCREIRKAKKMQRKDSFKATVKRCQTRVKKLSRWLSTAKRYMNCDSSGSTSDSSWQHTRSEDEEEDEPDPLKLATDSAQAALLGTAAELASILHDCNKVRKKNDLLGDGPSTSAQDLCANPGQKVMIDDAMPSTSKAAAAAAQALYGDNHNKESNSFQREEHSNLLSYLDNIPSTSKAAAASRVFYDYISQTTFDTMKYTEASNNDGSFQFLENLTNNSGVKIEPALVTEGPIYSEEFSLDDDQTSTSKAAAAKLSYRRQFLENNTTNLDGPLRSQETVANELSNFDHDVFEFLDDDPPITSGAANPQQGPEVKNEALNQELESFNDEQPLELETQTELINDDDNENLFDWIVVSSTEQINIPLGPENEISISAAAGTVEEFTEVNLLYNRQYLLPLTLADNEEPTSDAKVVYFIGYGNYSPEG